MHSEQKIHRRGASNASTCSFLLFFLLSLICGGRLTAQSTTNLPPSVLDKLCDYEQFLAEAKTPAEKLQREDLFLKMIGALDVLSSYRNQFLGQGNLIDLFPTAYYHTTLSEMEYIVDNAFDFPVEKLKQMLSFYDAYQRNRAHWDGNRKHLVEKHWEDHFYEANSGNANIINFGCIGIPIALEGAIEAHVNYDLPRAIRYAFENRFDRSLTKSMLWEEFKVTDRIFATTNTKTKRDIAAIRSCDVWWQNTGEFFFGWLFTTDAHVVDMRKDAWNQAFGGRPILGEDGYELIDQPFTNHVALRQRGEGVCPKNDHSSLFLFDLSGSMNEAGRSGAPKIQEAQAAAIATLQTMSQQTSVQQEVGLTAFSGDCVANPLRTSQLTFSSDLAVVEQSVRSLPGPGGGTPLPQAIAQAEQQFLAHLGQSGKGRLIILSDGQSTCGDIRPADVYAFGQTGQVRRTYGQSQTPATQVSAPSPIRYYTIGFNIAPGSPAERDLQYLAQHSGGRYLNAQNQFELTRAFKKFNRFYLPKRWPALPNTNDELEALFISGVAGVERETYEDALLNFKAFAEQAPLDCNGQYNLALMLEANERYKAAYTHYGEYLNRCPTAPDAEQVRERIVELKQEYQDYLAYNKQLIGSDFDYLNLYYGKIQNGESVALALEFVGFLKEKWLYYRDLPEILELEDRFFARSAEEVFRGLDECVDKIKSNPQKWDREATPILGRIYFNLDRLLREL